MATNKNGPCMLAVCPVSSNMDGWMEDTFIGSNSSTTQHEEKLYSQGELPRMEECFHHLIIYKHTWWKRYGVFSRLIWFFYSPLSPRNLCNCYCSPLPGKSERDWLLQVMMNFHWTCANQIEFPIIDRVIWGVRLCRRKAFAYLTETKLHKLIFINNWQMTAINICLILLSI